MPDNFIKITLKWLAILIAVNYLANTLYSYILTTYIMGSGNFYNNMEWISYLIAFLYFIIFSLCLGFGLRNLSRSNQYQFPIGSVFGFTGLMILVPLIFNFVIFYFQSLYNEELTEHMASGSYRLQIIIGFLMYAFYSMMVITLAAQWRMFRKAGKKGWYALIPFVNLAIMCDIIKRDRSLVFLFLVPIMNLVGWATVTNGLAKRFNKSPSFSIGLFFLPFIFFPILGFGKTDYEDGEFEVVRDDLLIEDHLVD